MPSQNDQIRVFPCQRWLNIALRTAHVTGVVLLGAALMNELPLNSGVYLTFVSGAGMFLIDCWSKPDQLRETAGAGVCVKLILVALMTLRPAWAMGLFWLILAISMVLSHAPGAFRHRRLF